MKDAGGYKMPKSREGKATLIWLWDATHVDILVQETTCAYVRVLTMLHTSYSYTFLWHRTPLVHSALTTSGNTRMIC
jgi:hypothetical protein